jgi:hypothetical protein
VICLLNELGEDCAVQSRSFFLLQVEHVSIFRVCRVFVFSAYTVLIVEKRVNGTSKVMLYPLAPHNALL